MAPSPQSYTQTPQDVTPNVNLDEKVVISGISGLYPQSHNVKELSKILYEKINPVSDENRRWDYEHPELSQYSGKAPEVDLFDAQFFGVHYFLSNSMDALGRKVLEQTYQAIYDAGVNPVHLSSKKIGVYVGASFSESERTHYYDKSSRTGLGLVGCSRTMFANRISYWLNLKGPSMAIDLACCSSTLALEQAYLAIKRGECEAAIVTGSSLCMLPQTPIQYKRVIDITKDGKTKSYDDNANGCVISDAISVVFLQKAKDALRVYAEVVHVKTEFTGVVQDDTGPRYGFNRTPGSMTQFIKKFYKEAQVSPQDVEYVEGLGSANPGADKTELQLFEEVFLEGRRDTLLVGSITSNIGFTQATSGLCGVVKVLLGYYTGYLASNLHCTMPRSDVAALSEGRMRVVTEQQQFCRTYAAVNGMSYTGVNSHVLLYGQYKPKNLTKYSSNIPRLVTISGRHELAVNKIIEDLKTRSIDPEEIALLHNIHSSHIVGHMSRGYVILDVNKEQKTMSLSEKIVYFNETRRPLWFVYSGMGSQWAGMGAQLMRIPIFARAIKRCQHVLAAKGLDLIHIITSPNKSVYDNILHSFVGIAAVQIGLTDVLTELGLTPDGIIGHSVGELGCAYADGCLTAEEMILAAYSRGLVSLETPFIRGSMAAIGLGYKQILNFLPPEIAVACHNGPESCTISGPADKVNVFVAELTAKGVFAKEVACSNIAYHSQYIAEAGPRLLKYLSDVIKHLKPRSERWLSTSVSQDKWHESTAKINSAEYHTNNLLSPVLFEETSQLIPSNAVLVEVAPHGLLQAILKRSLSDDCRHVPLTRRGHTDNTVYLLQAIGTLYMEGFNPRVEILYPKVQFPVSTETPMLSHLVEWAHEEKWNVPVYAGMEKRTASSCKFVISTQDDEHSYLNGHVVRGKIVYPFAGALVAVWDTLAMHTGSMKRQMSVQFREVHLHVQPTLYNHRPLRLSVTIHRGDGWFEVTNEKCKVASGYIFADEEDTIDNEFQIDYRDDNYELKQDDLYQLLHERDYYYSADFRSIECANEFFNKAILVWRNNWVTFIDGMLQLNILRQAHDAVSLPTHIRRIDINVKKHLQYQIKCDTSDEMQFITAKHSDIELTQCGGITIQYIIHRNLPAMSKNNLKLTFLPIQDTQIIHADNTIQQQRLSRKSKLALKIYKPGNLSTLCWVMAPQYETSDIEVAVHYVGLNMLDAKKATGSVRWSDSNNALAMDFSGTNKGGERVMGIVKEGAASTHVNAQPDMLWPVPSHWSLEDAATVPLAYMHAFYCLSIKSRLQRGMSILIHGGAGALGQAAIAIALAHDCTVFTTVSDMKKKIFLKKLYPQLKDKFIGNSREDTFVHMILSNTNGLGCDIILCCLPKSLKYYTSRCVGYEGVTIDTTQIINRDNYYLGMFNLMYGRSYNMADFSSIFGYTNFEERKMLQRMLSEGIAQGYIRPLSRVVYAPNEAASAVRLLTSSQHRGRVLIQMQDIDIKQQTQHRISCSQEEGHLLVCDTNPLGMQLAERLVSRGARKLYIICENLTPYQIYKIRALKKLDILVKVFIVNFSERYAVDGVLKNSIKMKDIQGIYIVLKKFNSNITSTVVSKIVNDVDSTTRTSCPSFKYFAIVSNDNTKGYQACIPQATDRLGVMTIDLSLLSDVCPRDVVDIIEHGLNTSHPMLLVEQVTEKQSSLVDEIKNIIDIQLPNDGNSTLQELGVTSDKIQQIIMLLRDSYNLLLEEEEIFCLTIDRINEIDEMVLDNVKPVEGLAKFFSYLGLDEQVSMFDLVFLPTLALDLGNEDEFDPSQSYLCIVPGLEGHCERFRVLCERLKLPALVLQPGLDHHLREIIPETAERYIEILLKKAVFNNGEFYLLGYESGVLVALEMAAILENHGMTGTVFCLGYSPDEFQAVLQKQLAIYKTEEDLQDALVRHMYTMLGGKDITRLNNALKNTMTWSQKVDTCVGALLGRAMYSAQYVRALILTMLTHIEQVQRYQPTTHTLRSRLVLLRAATVNLPSDHSDLQRYSHQPLVVHQLQSPLGNASHDMQVTMLINKYLSFNILQLFAKRNLCHTYFVHDEIVVSKKI